jgi:hypothetical protein
MNDRLRRLTRRREWKLLLDEAAAEGGKMTVS